MNAFNLFDSVPVPDHAESQFNGNHDVTTSASFGRVEPLECLNYYPGDRFRMRYNIEAEFPPLLSPSFTRFKLNEYQFKVRKGLLFQNDKYETWMLSARGDVKDVPLHPSIPLSAQNMYGDAFVGIRFHSTLPFYTTFFNSIPYLQVNGFDDSVPSWNLLFKKMLDSVAVQNPVYFDVDEQVFYWEQFWKSLKIEIFDGKGFSRGEISHIQNNFIVNTQQKSTTFTNYIDLNVSSNWDFHFADDFLHNGDKYTTFLTLTDASHDPERFPCYIMPAIFSPEGLMEKLGYPCNDFYVDDAFFDKVWQMLTGQVDLKYGAVPTYQGIEQMQSAFMTFCNFGLAQNKDFLSDSLDATYTHIINYKSRVAGSLSPFTLLQKFLISASYSGAAGGRLIDYDESPVFSMFMLRDLVIFHQIMDELPIPDSDPVENSYYSKNLDLCRLTGYHLIYNEYFRDPNLTDELPLCKEYPVTHGYPFCTNTDYDDQVMSSYEAYKDFCLTKIYELNPTLDGDWNVHFFDNTTLHYDSLHSYIEMCVMLMYRMFDIRPKCMDKDYFSSALPNVSTVQVFAPVTQILPSNGAVPSMDAIPDFSPLFGDQVGDNLTFLSIEAFRTANILQSFYQNAYLAGPRPVSFILMMFGVHSQDFRMEIPVLCNASSKYVQIQELTQQSETEQLPLGYSASKASLFKSNDFTSIESDGDQGYIYTLFSLVPEYSFVGGLDKKLLCDNVFQTTFFPQFAVLGEEAIKKFEIQANPQSIMVMLDPDSADFSSLNETFGYNQRYANYKYIQSSVHGRFLTDLRYWHANRIYDMFNKKLALSNSLISVDVPKRMFVDDKAENARIFAVCECEFVRQLPNINPVKLL